MGAQHGSLGRTQSLDESVHQNNASSAQQSGSAQLRQNSSDSLSNRLERDSRSKSTLVIVHRPSMSDPVNGPGRVEDDPLFKKLEALPMFVTLMHEVETGSKLFGARNRALQEIRSKIQPSPFIHIVRLYEDRLKRHADYINVEQGRLSKCIREVDIDVSFIFKVLIERQKKFAKHVENMGRMNDLTHMLNKCQTTLRECERNLQILNGFLPKEERLEPFSWPELFVTEDERINVDDIRDKTSSSCPAKITLPMNNAHNLDSSDDSVEIAVEQGES